MWLPQSAKFNVSSKTKSIPVAMTRIARPAMGAGIGRGLGVSVAICRLW
jgi:hypothetical protein